MLAKIGFRFKSSYRKTLNEFYGHPNTRGKEEGRGRERGSDGGEKERD